MSTAGDGDNGDDGGGPGAGTAAEQELPLEGATVPPVVGGARDSTSRLHSRFRINQYKSRIPEAVGAHSGRGKVAENIANGCVCGHGLD